MHLWQGKRERAIEADACASYDKIMKHIIEMTVTGASLAGCANLGERWSRIFGPVVKVDCMTKEVIPNDKTKEPFARFQSQGCA